MVKFFRYLFVGAPALLLVACEETDFSFLKAPVPLSTSTASADVAADDVSAFLELGELIQNSQIDVDVDSGFKNAMLQAVDQDPAVLAAKNEVLASKAKLRVTETGGDTQINATILGGIEDITDETMGIAAILTANRMLYDGGMLDAKVDADTFYSTATGHAYLATRDKSALELATLWIELERYKALSELISSRLAVLDPLLVQLEKVTTAGLGDVSQVAAAQRVVSAILVAEADVSGRYQKARIAFSNGFGTLPSTAKYNASWASAAVPTAPMKELVESSPGLVAKYWAYRAAEAYVVSVGAQDNFTIGFKVRLQRPFGGSEANADESVGFALTKDLYKEDQLEAQVNRAEASARAAAAQVAEVYQDNQGVILAAREMIKTMDKAIELARRNAVSSREEIDYLRKQLIIGGSTLETVLSAEARLYDAESKEISLIAERRQAEMAILATSGYLTKALSSN